MDSIRFGGREVKGDAWVEGTGFFRKIWWDNKKRCESWFIIESRPSGLEVKKEIKPESFRIEVGGLWYTQDEVVGAVKDVESIKPFRINGKESS